MQAALPPNGHDGGDGSHDGTRPWPQPPQQQLPVKEEQPTMVHLTANAASSALVHSLSETLESFFRDGMDVEASLDPPTAHQAAPPQLPQQQAGDTWAPHPPQALGAAASAAVAAAAAAAAAANPANPAPGGMLKAVSDDFASMFQFDGTLADLDLDSLPDIFSRPSDGQELLGAAFDDLMSPGAMSSVQTGPPADLHQIANTARSVLEILRVGEGAEGSPASATAIAAVPAGGASSQGQGQAAQQAQHSQHHPQQQQQFMEQERQHQEHESLLELLNSPCGAAGGQQQGHEVEEEEVPLAPAAPTAVPPLGVQYQVVSSGPWYVDTRTGQLLAAPPTGAPPRTLPAALPGYPAAWQHQAVQLGHGGQLIPSYQGHPVAVVGGQHPMHLISPAHLHPHPHPQHLPAGASGAGGPAAGASAAGSAAMAAAAPLQPTVLVQYGPGPGQVAVSHGVQGTLNMQGMQSVQGTQSVHSVGSAGGGGAAASGTPRKQPAKRSKKSAPVSMEVVSDRSARLAQGFSYDPVTGQALRHGPALQAAALCDREVPAVAALFGAYAQQPFSASPPPPGYAQQAHQAMGLPLPPQHHQLAPASRVPTPPPAYSGTGAPAHHQHYQFHYPQQQGQGQQQGQQQYPQQYSQQYSQQGLPAVHAGVVMVAPVHAQPAASAAQHAQHAQQQQQATVAGLPAGGPAGHTVATYSWPQATKQEPQEVHMAEGQPQQLQYQQYQQYHYQPQQQPQYQSFQQQQQQGAAGGHGSGGGAYHEHRVVASAGHSWGQAASSGQMSSEAPNSGPGGQQLCDQSGHGFIKSLVVRELQSAAPPPTAAIPASSEPACRDSNNSGLKGVTRDRWSLFWDAYLEPPQEAQPEGSSLISGFKQEAIFLGKFPTREQAGRAHDLAALKLVGPGAQTNFPSASYQKVLPTLAAASGDALVAAIRKDSQLALRRTAKLKGVRRVGPGQFEARADVEAGSSQQLAPAVQVQSQAEAQQAQQAQQAQAGELVLPAWGQH